MWNFFDLSMKASQIRFFCKNLLRNKENCAFEILVIYVEFPNTKKMKIQLELSISFLLFFLSRFEEDKSLSFAPLQPVHCVIPSDF
jgi:hypothetical protein